ncbi:hypothetical protein SAICODRAFT_148351 [Saitoella complicata NRRL Y-17804]|uniref:uncharacterized protein n=1 Tax=Saitoella complicata (strain BCRC 22490 / CBS 7301 / JCM 7358 / NBRC 10748 / NRRL Y-17804) TaxID=698492 RepID=UPI000866D02E|nr:uncharacterized protein SAICODRAFT_148351 [Saitoella complicata NRRL Y-17804]ODQ55558.1 hypothetical protein SAICODRAFT_148351 [Saitoella complicata NRRL Y-17804]
MIHSQLLLLLRNMLPLELLTKHRLHNPLHSKEPNSPRDPKPKCLPRQLTTRILLIPRNPQKRQSDRIDDESDHCVRFADVAVDNAFGGGGGAGCGSACVGGEVVGCVGEVVGGFFDFLGADCSFFFAFLHDLSDLVLYLLRFLLDILRSSLRMRFHLLRLHPRPLSRGLNRLLLFLLCLFSHAVLTGSDFAGFGLCVGLDFLGEEVVGDNGDGAGVDVDCGCGFWDVFGDDFWDGVRHFFFGGSEGWLAYIPVKRGKGELTARDRA